MFSRVCPAILLAAMFPAMNASAQTVEITPIAGYRFGGGFFEELTQQPVDLDGAASFGGVVNVAFRDTLLIEALFTHQEATLVVPASLFGPETRWRLTVDHMMAGGLQEFGTGRARPFLTGLLGLTRYAAPGDAEIRFTAGAGGGVRLFPVRNLGVRLDGRVFATLADLGGRAFACTPGFCLVSFDATFVWQAEFTAGLTVRF
jgi:hypothetical protein